MIILINENQYKQLYERIALEDSNLSNIGDNGLEEVGTQAHIGGKYSKPIQNDEIGAIKTSERGFKGTNSSCGSRGIRTTKSY